MDDHELRHAYGVLELSPPVTEARLKRRYKTLVRRWHPDRYQDDPIGKGEAAQRLRDINVAYELVARSLDPTDAPPEKSPESEMERPFSWTPERVDDVVNSINQRNKLSLLPKMSAERWLSIGAVLVYLMGASLILPGDFAQRREIGKAVSLALAYFSLPLYLIWSGGRDDLSSLESALYRISGWLFIAAPAVVIVALRIAG